MPSDRFVELVRRMRAAQKRYYQTRDHEALVEAKTLEARVDDWLSHGSRSMFDETID